MKEYVTEMKIGKTLFIVCAEHSPDATETVEQKLKRLVTQHALKERKVISHLLGIPHQYYHRRSRNW